MWVTDRAALLTRSNWPRGRALAPKKVCAAATEQAQSSHEAPLIATALRAFALPGSMGGPPEGLQLVQKQSRRQKGKGGEVSTCGEEETQEGDLVSEPPPVLNQISGVVAPPGLLSPESICL